MEMKITYDYNEHGDGKDIDNDIDIDRNTATLNVLQFGKIVR